MNIRELVVLALLISTNVEADFLDNDTYTTDTLSGLDWLDLTESTGLSHDQVSAQFGVGGLYEGWRYAETYEVYNLFYHAGGAGEFSFYYRGWSEANNGVVIPLLDLWGYTGNGQDSSFLSTYTGSGYTSVRQGDLSDSIDNPSSETMDWMYYGYDVYGTTAHSSIGSALVRQSRTVNAADLLLVMRILLGHVNPTPLQMTKLDVAPIVAGVPVPDGQITAGDYVVITREVLGLKN